MKNFGCVVILIAVLAILLALLVPYLPVDAKSEKTPVPHHNKDDKTVPANCHSRHAREAGMECDDGTKKQEKKPAVTPAVSVPNSNKRPLLTPGTVPGSDPRVYLPVVLRDNSSGSPNPYPYPAP